MLYQFLLNFVDIYGFLNVFKYLTFRTGLSVFTSLIIVLIIGNPFIKFFKSENFKFIRDDGPEDHIVKDWYSYYGQGNNSIKSFNICTMLKFIECKYFICLYIAISFGLLGAFDDYKKIKQSHSSEFHLVKDNLQIFLSIIGVSFYVYFVDYQV